MLSGTESKNRKLGGHLNGFWKAYSVEIVRRRII